MGRKLSRCALLLALSSAGFFCCAPPVSAQATCLQKLLASDGQIRRNSHGNYFGSQVWIDGDTLLVESFAGFAYVFGRQEGVWTEEVRLSRPQGFTGSAALHGERIVFGARHAVPLLVRRDGDRWVKDGSLNPEGDLPNSYGQYYALSGDHAAVAASGTNEVFFFRREGDEEWIQEDRVSRGENGFGWTLALDGDRAVVGEPGDPTNAAIVLRRTVDGDDVTWEIEDELQPSDDCASFGADVAISGDVVIVGSAPEFSASPCGRAYVFRYDPATVAWIEEQVLEPGDIVPKDRFGISVSVSGDVAAIGAMGDSQHEGGSGFGAAYVYRYDGNAWLQAGRLAPPRQQRDDWFGRSVSVSGNTVIVGARQDDELSLDAGAAYSFVLGPQTSFTVSPEEATVGEEIRFDASATTAADDHEIVSYRWDLGDGAVAEDPLVTHSYSEGGRFLVSLAANDESGGCGDTSTLVTVSCPAGDVSPWTSGAVGEPAFPGAARFEGQGESRELVLCAGGANIQTNSRPDEFHFVYREVTGDVILTARISEVSEVSEVPVGKVGIMLREREPGARHAALVFVNSMFTGRSGRFQFIHREETDGPGRGTSGENAAPPDVWLQLRREGNEFIAMSSIDGQSWTEAGRVSLELPETILAGVAATGRDGNPQPQQSYLPMVARVAELTISPLNAVAESTFVRGDTNADSDVDVSDGIALLDFLFHGAGGPTCGKSADANDSGGLDVSDVIFLLNHLFGRGPGLRSPAKECGVDPTPDELTCEGHAPCF